MPEPSKQPALLKDYYSIELVKSIAQNCKAQYGNFDVSAFEKNVIADDWTKLELKDRMHRIADVLGEYLPNSYKRSISIILKVASHYSGLAHMCFPDFVGKFGMDDFETSMMALETLTEGSSSEFAIRPFIIRYPDLTMKRMKHWAKSDNYHVRRLATEGCRPRLPWAMALPKFKQDPSVVLETIMSLIDDDELYVRRSVANNLNDISKDNPAMVIEIAKQYLGNQDLGNQDLGSQHLERSKEVDWVIKHACRGLLKQGQKDILELFGFSKAKHVKVDSFEVDAQVALGDKLNFSFALKSNNKSLGKLRVEFVIEFMKANGKLSGKIFKICEGEYSEKEKAISKYFSFKEISTRKYYLGKHQIAIVVNGERLDSFDFNLV